MKTYKIIQDQDAADPRTEWDNLGTMVCFHKRYDLGDKHSYRHSDYSSCEELEADIRKRENVAAILPLFLYDHSGITMNTIPFGCHWDSGQVGFIFISKVKALEEFGGKIVTKKLRERLETYLRNEVKTYDQYLTGDVWGIQIFEDDEEIDSVWGFYDRDYAEQEAKAMCDL